MSYLRTKRRVKARAPQIPLPPQIHTYIHIQIHTYIIHIQIQKHTYIPDGCSIFSDDCHLNIRLLDSFHFHGFLDDFVNQQLTCRICSIGSKQTKAVFTGLTGSGFRRTLWMLMCLLRRDIDLQTLLQVTEVVVSN